MTVWGCGSDGWERGALRGMRVWVPSVELRETRDKDRQDAWDAVQGLHGRAVQSGDVP